jgi:hypothetical protein
MLPKYSELVLIEFEVVRPHARSGNLSTSFGLCVRGLFNRKASCAFGDVVPLQQIRKNQNERLEKLKTAG